MMYRDNTAYDFEMFTTKKKVVEIPNNRSEKKRTSSSAKKAVRVANRSRLMVIGAVAVVFMLIIAQLHCQLQNTEVVEQIYQTEKEIETLQSENVRLQTEVNGKISFANMESNAKAMGMQKIAVAQVEYVNLSDDEPMETAKGNTGLVAMVAEWF